MVMTLTPLATSDDFTNFGSNQELIQSSKGTTRWTAAALTRLMLRATTIVENKCGRRLAPFSGKLESHRAYGISPDEYGEQGDLAMNLTSAMGASYAQALGVSDMVREFWLDETAPVYQEWWTYNLETVEILRTFGDTQTFTTPDFVSWQGPEVDTGHIKMPIGIYCPVNSTIRVTYGGGYTPIPEDLNLACVLQAMKYVLIGAEPEARKDMSTANLDGELLESLIPYLRGE